jgi:hypothetical protein
MVHKEALDEQSCAFKLFQNSLFQNIAKQLCTSGHELHLAKEHAFTGTIYVAAAALSSNRKV